MIHALKTWPVYFQAIKRGDKTFEIRRNDRAYNVGDYLELHEWNPDTMQFTDEQPFMVKVTYILKAIEMPDCSYVCMSIKPESEERT